jgi:hypothetical protein
MIFKKIVFSILKLAFLSLCILFVNCKNNEKKGGKLAIDSEVKTTINFDLEKAIKACNTQLNISVPK